MKRGEIYYVSIPASTGAEMTKTRPAVCVSGDAALASGALPSFAFCSAQAQSPSKTHVPVRSTPYPSTVLCEHTYAVDPSRVENYVGDVSAEELRRIDAALCAALGLFVPAKVPERNDDAAALRAELAVYKRLYDDLLGRLTGRGA